MHSPHPISLPLPVVEPENREFALWSYWMSNAFLLSMWPLILELIISLNMSHHGVVNPLSYATSGQAKRLWGAFECLIPSFHVAT